MRKAFDGLSVLAQEVLREDPFSGHLFVFRGNRSMALAYLDQEAAALYRQGDEFGDNAALTSDIARRQARAPPTARV